MAFLRSVFSERECVLLSVVNVSYSNLNLFLLRLGPIVDTVTTPRNNPRVAFQGRYGHCAITAKGQLMIFLYVFRIELGKRSWWPKASFFLYALRQISYRPCVKCHYLCESEMYVRLFPYLWIEFWRLRQLVVVFWMSWKIDCRLLVGLFMKRIICIFKEIAYFHLFFPCLKRPF